MNSLNKPAMYLVRELESRGIQVGPAEMKAILSLGGVTGYGKPITPVLMPGISAGFGDSTLALGAVPPIKGVTPLTLALQMRQRF